MRGSSYQGRGTGKRRAHAFRVRTFLGVASVFAPVILAPLAAAQPVPTPVPGPGPSDDSTVLVPSTDGSVVAPAGPAAGEAPVVSGPSGPLASDPPLAAPPVPPANPAPQVVVPQIPASPPAIPQIPPVTGGDASSDSTTNITDSAPPAPTPPQPDQAPTQVQDQAPPANPAPPANQQQVPGGAQGGPEEQGGPRGPRHTGGSGGQPGSPGGPGDGSQQPGGNTGGSQGPWQPGNGGPHGPGDNEDHNQGPGRGHGDDDQDEPRRPHDGPPRHFPKPPMPPIPPNAPVDNRPPWQMPLPPPHQWHNPWQSGRNISFGLVFEHTSSGPEWYNNTGVGMYFTLYEGGDVNRPCGTVFIPPHTRRGLDGFQLREGASYAWAGALEITSSSGPYGNQFELQGAGSFRYGNFQAAGSISIRIWNGYDYRTVQFDDYDRGDGYVFVNVPCDDGSVQPLYIYGHDEGGVWTADRNNGYSSVPTSVPAQRVDKPPFEVTVDGGMPGQDFLRDHPTLAWSGVGGVAVLLSLASGLAIKARRMRRREAQSVTEDTVSAGS